MQQGNKSPVISQTSTTMSTRDCLENGEGWGGALTYLLDEFKQRRPRLNSRVVQDRFLSDRLCFP